MKMFPRTVFALLMIGIFCICLGLALMESRVQASPEMITTGFNRR